MLHFSLTLYLLLINFRVKIVLFRGTNRTFVPKINLYCYIKIMVVFSEDHIQETRRRGRIEVICGSMFSGKTEELIRRLKERNLPVNGLKYSNRPWTHAIQKKKSYHMTVIPLHPPPSILLPVSYFSHQTKT